MKDTKEDRTFYNRINENNTGHTMLLLSCFFANRQQHYFLIQHAVLSIMNFTNILTMPIWTGRTGTICTEPKHHRIYAEHEALN